LHALGSCAKDGKIVALGDLDEHLFAASLIGEVGRELQAEKPGLRAHDAVVAGIVARDAVKDMNADLLLGGFFGGVTQTAINHIKKELDELGRGVEMRAYNDTLSEGPTRIIHLASKR
jgi:hypothetical protein